jgi:hypothetical protein
MANIGPALYNVKIKTGALIPFSAEPHILLPIALTDTRCRAIKVHSSILVNLHEGLGKRTAPLPGPRVFPEGFL